MFSLDTTESFNKEQNVVNEKPSTGGGETSNSSEPEAQHRGSVFLELRSLVQAISALTPKPQALVLYSSP
jgi:hypothetical protein